MISVRTLAPADASRAIRLLREFVPQVGADDWARVLVGGSPEQPRTIGLGLFAGEDLVGFLATILSSRQIGGRTETFCNLHSVYVRPEYASNGAYLLLTAMSKRDTTLTALTPSPRVAKILRSARFKILDVGYRLYPPLMNLGTIFRSGIKVARVNGLEPWLDVAEARLLRDHDPLGCRGYAVRDKDAYALLITMRNRIRKLPFLHASDALYVRNPELAALHFERLKLAILWSDRTVLLRVDERLLGHRPRYGLSRSKVSFFRSRTLGPDEIDNLYSEMLFHDLLSALPEIDEL